MKGSLLSREVLPFFLAFTALVAAALLFDALLHILNAVWIGRYLGIPGKILIVGCFGY
jgi:lipopolysaccharide export LptBFGC system permease protein LptF